MKPKMTWTSTKPTVEGWYWFKREKLCTPGIVYIRVLCYKQERTIVMETSRVWVDVPDEMEWSSTPIPQPEDEL